MRKSYFLAILGILISTFTIKLYSQQIVGIYNSDLTIRDKGILDTFGEYPTKFMYYSEKGSIKMGALTSDTSNYQPSNFGWLNFDFGLNNNTLANYSFVHGGSHNTTGALNFNSGGNNNIEGAYNVSFGALNSTLGDYNFLSGLSHEVESTYNSILGNNNHSSAQHSILLGSHLESQSAYSINLGRYNLSNGDNENWILNDPLLTVGNGSSANERSNALTILKNGVIISNGNVLPSNSAASTQNLMFFDPISGSFRAGRLDNSTAWANLGTATFAIGENTISTGINSSAFGKNTQSTGGATVSFGTNSIASNDNAMAAGLSTQAIGRHSTALGNGTVAGANSVFAFGQYNIGGGNPEEWTYTDPLFEIGNGISDTQRANALTMRKDGRTIIGKRNFALQDRLTVNSEAGEPSFRVQVNNQTKLRVHGNGSVTLGVNNTNVSSNDVYIANDLGIGIDSAEARLDVNGSSIIRGNSNITGDAIVDGNSSVAGNSFVSRDAIINGNSLVAGNSLVSGYSLVTGSSIIEFNSGGSNGPQLELHETTSDDYARLMFTNKDSDQNWTIAAKSENQPVGFSGQLNIFFEPTGNILTVRSSRRVGINRQDPTHPLHVGIDASTGNGAHVTAGGTWTNGSSRTFKENFQKVNNASILATLMGLDILKWEYKGSNEGQHLGPIAEEFHEAFGLGTDEKYISTVDIDGVALASIQALAQQNKELESKLSKVEEENAELRNRLAKIESILSEMHK